MHHQNRLGQPGCFGSNAIRFERKTERKRSTNATGPYTDGRTRCVSGNATEEKFGRELFRECRHKGDDKKRGS